MKIIELCKQNSASILTGLGVAGVFSTAVLAAKDTPKALRLLEEKEEYKLEHYGCKLTKTEKIFAMIPAYIPTILMGTATTACILGANHINKQNQAALIAAYTYLDSEYKAYQNKVKDIFGEAAEKKVLEEIEKDKYRHEQYGDPSEKKLFYDEFSNRYFEMSIHEILQAMYEANRIYAYLGELTLNGLYEFLHLKPIDIGETLGWSAGKDWECYGFAWLDISWEAIETPDNLEAYAIKFNIDPSKDFQEW